MSDATCMNFRRSSRPSPLSRPMQRGFSLIELFIVIALVGILATIATPYFKDMIGRGRLNSATREMMGYIKVARMMAVARGLYTRVVFVSVDSNPASGSNPAGLYRVEQYAPDPVGILRWVVIDDPLSRPSSTLPNNTCTVGSGPTGRLGEYCIDMVDRYQDSVSLAWVDPVGSGVSTRNSGDPMLEFGPDGFITNPNSEFQFGNEQQEIQIVVSSKRSNGMLESRIVRIDRAGNVAFSPYRGAGVPST